MIYAPPDQIARVGARRLDVAVSDVRRLEPAFDGLQAAESKRIEGPQGRAFFAPSKVECQSVKTNTPRKWLLDTLAWKSDLDDAEKEASVVPSTSAELRTAIQALNSSTKSLERRAKIIDAQDRHAKLLVHAQDVVQDEKSSNTKRLFSKQASELQRVRFAVSMIDQIVLDEHSLMSLSAERRAL